MDEQNSRNNRLEGENNGQRIRNLSDRENSKTKCIVKLKNKTRF